MAAGAASENDTIDQSAILTENIKTKPQYSQSLSRTSVTFFSSENAEQIAKRKIEELKAVAFKTEENEEEGKEENKESDDGEKKLVSFVLNHVRNYFYYIF